MYHSIFNKAKIKKLVRNRNYYRKIALQLLNDKNFLVEAQEKQQNAEHNEKGELDDQDPFKILCSDLHHLIFQHLTGAEILQMSEVSQGWFELTNSSKNMSKIVLGCENFLHKSLHYKANHFKALRQSSRQYSNVKITYDTSTLINSIRVLRQFGETLGTLEISEKASVDFNLNFQEWKNLKKLKLGSISKSMASYLLNDKLQLETLVIDDVFNFELSGIKVTRFLLSQKYLKAFYVLGGSKSRIQSGLMIFVSTGILRIDSKLPFQLDKLFVGVCHDLFGDHQDQLQVGLLHFIRLQSNSLQELVVLCVANKEILNLIFNDCPKLKTVELSCVLFYQHAIDELNLTINQNIEELRIGKSFPDQDIILMLLSTPRLKILGIQDLKNSHIKLAAENLKILELLEYNMIEDTDFYEEMKKSRSDINKNFVIREVKPKKTIFGDDF